MNFFGGKFSFELIEENPDCIPEIYSFDIFCPLHSQLAEPEQRPVCLNINSKIPEKLFPEWSASFAFKIGEVSSYLVIFITEFLGEWFGPCPFTKRPGCESTGEIRGTCRYVTRSAEFTGKTTSGIDGGSVLFQDAGDIVKS